MHLELWVPKRHWELSYIPRPKQKRSEPLSLENKKWQIGQLFYIPFLLIQQSLFPFSKKKKKNCIQREPFHFKYNKPNRNVHQPGSLKLELLLEECLKPFSMSPPESEWICLEINKIISIWHAFKENQCPNQIHHRKNMTTGKKKIKYVLSRTLQIL